MDTDRWQEARLIPTSGINGQDEAERRATSALLAVIQAVREFRVALLKPLRAPAGTATSYIEVPFSLDEDRTVIPDGVIRIERGKTSWTALVEVKTGNGELQREQVENYLDIARIEGFDCVITISNQLAPAAGVHPVVVDKRKLRKVELFHLSWAEVVTAAIRTRVHTGVDDPDQAWILGELIRYLEHPKSGALDFSDMGPHWVSVREATIAGTARVGDKGVVEVASRWDQLLRFAALRLGRELGAEVQVVVPRKELADPNGRLTRFVQELTTTGCLLGTIRIPDAVGDVLVFCDLRASTVSVTLDVAAPQEGRAQTRVNWLVRQLADAPGQIRVDALLAGTAASLSELLSTLRDDPTKLIDSSGRDPRLFRITARATLGTKRGTGRGSFIDSVLAAIDGFYEEVVQNVRPWSAKAPRLPKAGRSAVEEAGIDISPPASDFADLSAATDDTSDIESVNSAVGSDGADVLARPDHDIVVWEHANDRIERERDHSPT